MRPEDRARRVKAAMERTRSMLPSLLDKAIETGDFEPVSRAQALTDRLLQVGDNTVNEMSSGLPQPKEEAEPGPGGGELGESPDLAEGGDNDTSSPAATPPPAGPPKYDMKGLDRLISEAKNEPEPEAGPDIAPGAKAAGSLLPKLEPSVTKPDVPPAPASPAPAPKPDFQVSSREENPQAPDAVSPDEVEAAIPHVNRKYGSRADLAMDDIIRFAQETPPEQVDPSEREFLARVKAEIGERPKMFTVAKVLAALSVGAGSILAAWLKGRYEGQALLDMDADQKHYDKRRSEIASEVYSQNKVLDRARLNADEARNRMLLHDINVADRQTKNNEFKGDQTTVREAGKKERLEYKEGQANTRQDNAIKARKEMMQLRISQEDKLPPKEKENLNVIKQQVSNLQKNMLYSEDPDGDKQKIALLLKQYNDIMVRNGGKPVDFGIK